MKENNDFLSQFNKDSYQETKGTKKAEAKPSPDLPQKSEATGSQGITAPEHVVEVDNSYHKRKLIRYGVIGGIALIVCIFIFLIVRMMNQVEVRDFTGVSINEARTWAMQNGITIEDTFEFDLEQDENNIIDQDREPGSRMQRGSVLRLTVSKGADPDELIELPDFAQMTFQEIQLWMQGLRLNATIQREYSTEVPDNEFIRKEFANDTVTADNYRRSDRLTIFISRGVQYVQVPNFREEPNNTQTSVETWATQNGITVNFQEEPSSEIEPGFVISQSVQPGGRITSEDTLTVVISGGQTVTVPDFNTIPEDEWGTTGLTVNARRRYHAEVPFGHVIYQSEAPGTELFGNAPEITVIFSRGLPYMDSMIGSSQSEIPQVFFDFRTRGANITYTIRNVDSSEPRGQIVAMSRHGEWLRMTDHVTFDVSRGNMTPPATSFPEGDSPELGN